MGQVGSPFLQVEVRSRKREETEQVKAWRGTRARKASALVKLGVREEEEMKDKADEVGLE